VRHDVVGRRRVTGHIQGEASKLESWVILVVLLVEPLTAPTSLCGCHGVGRDRGGNEAQYQELLEAA
jgi:hypothetical protein